MRINSKRNKLVSKKAKYILKSNNVYFNTNTNNKNLNINKKHMEIKIIRFCKLHVNDKVIAKNSQVVLNVLKARNVELGFKFTNADFYLRLGVAYFFVGFFFVSIYYTFLSYEYNHFLAITLEKYPLPPVNMSTVRIVWPTVFEQTIHVLEQYKVCYKFEFYEPLFNLIKGKPVLSAKTAVFLYPESIQTKFFWSHIYSNASLLSGTAFIVSLIIALN